LGGTPPKSFSNISTSMLCRGALHLTGGTQRYRDNLNRVEAWLFERTAKTPANSPKRWRQRYGKDRTFSVPILTTCALAGLVSWDEVPRLPFELACFPQSWFRFLRLHVVSYGAAGVDRHWAVRPPAQNRVVELVSSIVRWLAKGKACACWRAIQPSSGRLSGRTPLTSS